MRAARTLRRRWALSLTPWDLSPHQARALRVVCARNDTSPAGVAGSDSATAARSLPAPEPPRVCDIADTLCIAARSATEVIDALEAKGLVVRTPSARDRRAVGVTPTAAGRQVREAIEQARVDEADDFFAPLTAPDRETLARILRTSLGE